MCGGLERVKRVYCFVDYQITLRQINIKFNVSYLVLTSVGYLNVSISTPLEKVATNPG